MNVSLLGIDLAKNVFQLHGIDKKGKPLMRKQLKREHLLSFIANTPPCIIAMEACGSAHYWGRQFEKLGHIVKLISPQYVKPFVKGNKNDRNDAQAITEAASRANQFFVPIKGVAQQDIQNIHRVRQRLLTQRTALSNQIRGLLAEYGIVIAKGFSTLKKRLPQILEDAENELTADSREVFFELQEEFMALDKRVLLYDHKLKQLFKTNKNCQRIANIEGIGPIVATAILSRLVNPRQFKNGRHFSAFLGLVPGHVSSGGKRQLLGISKRGDVYVRTMLIHGARSAVIAASKKTDSRSLWLQEIEARRGINRASVALANKNARIIWSLVAHQQEYQAAM